MPSSESGGGASDRTVIGEPIGLSRKGSMHDANALHTGEPAPKRSGRPRPRGRGAKRGARKTVVRKGKAPSLPIGRPPRLAHLVPGTDRQRKRERALQVSTEAAPAAVSTQSRNPTAPLEDLPQPGALKNIFCLPSPEWLPHVLTVNGPLEDLAAFRRAAAGPGVIPWVMDYGRLEEDWSTPC